MLRKHAADIRELVAVHAGSALEAAAEATKSGVKTAAPTVMRAVDATVKTATPLLDSAADSAVKFTEKAGTTLDRVHRDMVNDYLPRINQAVEEAAARANALAQDHAVAPAAIVVAAVEAESVKRSRGRRCRKGIKWTLAAAGAAGVAYLLWRRAQPIEDPWAEEYWSDLETDVDVTDVPTEPVDLDAVEDADEGDK